MKLKSNLKWIFLAIIIFAFGPVKAVAEELKYQPIDPGFGGNPFNGSYVLGSAEAQKQFDPPERSRKPAIEEFEENISRSLINRISQDIADTILGEDAKESGTFSVGDTTVDFHRVNDQVEIQIRDTQTGGMTTIQLPVPQY